MNGLNIHCWAAMLLIKYQTLVDSDTDTDLEDTACMENVLVVCFPYTADYWDRLGSYRTKGSCAC